MVELKTGAIAAVGLGGFAAFMHAQRAADPTADTKAALLATAAGVTLATTTVVGAGGLSKVGPAFLRNRAAAATLALGVPALAGFAVGKTSSKHNSSEAGQFAIGALGGPLLLVTLAGGLAYGAKKVPVGMMEIALLGGAAVGAGAWAASAT